MKKLQAPKGLFDILPYGAKEPWQQSHLWQYVEEKVRSICSLYGFEEIRTPVFESIDVFSIGIGATSDIISKEMYTFHDKKNRKQALRPEGTSAVLRAFFEANISNKQKVSKLFYIAPMFRYERPQKGRYRQHHQFGAEVFGSASYEQDVEVIDLLLSFYESLKIKNLSLEINSVGDASSRKAYKQALSSYLKPHLEQLSPDSQTRFTQNILRILDSKDPQDKEIIKKAPLLLDYLSPSSKAHFSGLESALKSLQIPYTINPFIVRGLDYYENTVFEIVTKDLGAQNAIGAGGRYDGFPKRFSGQDIAGVGFGTGLERVLQTLLAQGAFIPEKKSPFVFLAPMNATCRKALLPLTKQLRAKGIFAEIDLKIEKIQHLLRKADQLNASYCLLFGEEEEAKGVIRCKHMKTRTETLLPLREVALVLEKKWEKER